MSPRQARSLAHGILMVGFPHNSFRDNVGEPRCSIFEVEIKPRRNKLLKTTHVGEKKNHSRIMVRAKSMTLYLTSVDNFALLLTEMIPGFSLSKDNGCL